MLTIQLATCEPTAWSIAWRSMMTSRNTCQKIKSTRTSARSHTDHHLAWSLNRGRPMPVGMSTARGIRGLIRTSALHGRQHSWHTTSLRMGKLLLTVTQTETHRSFSSNHQRTAVVHLPAPKNSSRDNGSWRKDLVQRLEL